MLSLCRFSGVLSFVLLGQKGGLHPLQGSRGMRGRRRCVFLSFFFNDFFFNSKRKDEEEKKGGVSDGGEADFQTRPPTLTTYPRFFFKKIF